MEEEEEVAGLGGILSGILRLSFSARLVSDMHQDLRSA